MRFPPVFPPAPPAPVLVRCLSGFRYSLTSASCTRPALAPGPSWSQHLTDLIWHSSAFRVSGSVVLAAFTTFFAIRAFSYWRYRSGLTGTLVAQPPGRSEHQQYFQVQGRRLLTVLFAVLSAGSIYGMWEVFGKSWVWRPWLIVLLVLVPWSLYTTAVSLCRPVITPATHASQLDGAAQGIMAADVDVDVFVPYAGEGLDVLANTLAHVRELKWPGGVYPYLLDDSKHGPEVRKLAAEYGILYLYRPNRGEYKKAGNLNYAVSQTFSEFIVVFDADFVPAQGFLEQVMPYFSDATTGIVQTSQYFSIRRRDTANWMARLAGTVQGMFFCWSQPGHHSMGSAFCVGTNVAYRRTALAAAGGFPEISGGEDLITTVEFLNAGFKTLYVPLNLARGLCPDTFASVVNQQYRWCLTTLAMVFPVKGIERVCDGFWRCPMSLRKRLIFMAGLLYYAQSLLVLVVTVLPSLIMLWAYPYELGPGNYLPILPSMFGLALLPLMIPGWRLEMMRLSLIYSAAHLMAIADAVTGRVAPWVPSGTSGRGTKTSAQAAFIVRSWILLTQGLAWWGIARDLPVYGMPAYWPAIFMTSVQTIIFAPLLLPGYGTVPVSEIIRRNYAQLARQLRRPARIAARPEALDLHYEPAGRR